MKPEENEGAGGAPAAHPYLKEQKAQSGQC